MFVGLVDTRKPEPEPEDEREPLLERIPELRPWRWYLATIVCLVASGYTPAWATVAPGHRGPVLLLPGADQLLQGQRRDERIPSVNDGA